MFRIHVKVAVKKGKVDLKALIVPKHKNNSRHITSLTVLLNGLMVSQSTLTPSMSKSPYIAVRFRGFVNDEYEMIGIDNLGKSYSKKGKVLA